MRRAALSLPVEHGCTCLSYDAGNLVNTRMNALGRTAVAWAPAAIALAAPRIVTLGAASASRAWET